MRKSPNHSPRVAAKRVPVLRLPVRHQAIARAMRPPSSGKAGTRLKTRTSRLMLPSQTTMAAMPEVWVFSWVSAAWRTWSPPASARPMIAQIATIAAVTSGPATAILNSVAGRVRVPFETCDSAEHPERDRGDLDPVAGRDEGVTQLVQQDRGEEEDRAGHCKQVWRGSALVGVQDVPVEAGQPEDDQEEDDEPGEVDGDPDSSDAKERHAGGSHSRILGCGCRFSRNEPPVDELS